MPNAAHRRKSRCCKAQLPAQRFPVAWPDPRSDWFARFGRPFCEPLRISTVDAFCEVCIFREGRGQDLRSLNEANDVDLGYGGRLLGVRYEHIDSKEGKSKPVAIAIAIAIAIAPERSPTNADAC